MKFLWFLKNFAWAFLLESQNENAWYTVLIFYVNAISWNNPILKRKLYFVPIKFWYEKMVVKSQSLIKFENSVLNTEILKKVKMWETFKAAKLSEK